MTIYLYGSDTCTACRQAVTLLGQTWIDWIYVDVNTLEAPYDGEIPVLISEEGQIIARGLGGINQYIKNQHMG